MARVLLMKGDLTAPPDAAGQDQQGQQVDLPLLQLPSPGGGGPAQFVLARDGLLELNRVRHAASSWLVGDAFVADGSAYLATPVNPVFVLLALLGAAPDQEGGMFQELESLLCCEDWPAAQQLQPLALQVLPCICDVRAVEGEAYFRLSARKALAYLRVCVRQALAAFQAHSPASVAGLGPDEQHAYVLRFLRDYLSQPWHDALLASYGLSAAALGAGDAGAAPSRPAAPQPGSQPDSHHKRPKALDPKEAARRKAEEGRAAAAAARLKAQAAGSRKISSFFTAAARKSG